MRSKNGCLWGGILLLAFVLAACSEEKLNFKDNFITSGINVLPMVFLDGAEYRDGHFQTQGWAVDREDNVAVRVYVYVDNKISGEAKMGTERRDVAAHFNRPEWEKSGWELKVKIPLSPGTHKVFAVAYDRMMGFARTPEREMTLP